MLSLKWQRGVGFSGNDPDSKASSSAETCERAARSDDRLNTSGSQKVHRHHDKLDDSKYLC